MKEDIIKGLGYSLWVIGTTMVAYETVKFCKWMDTLDAPWQK